MKKIYKVYDVKFSNKEAADEFRGGLDPAVLVARKIKECANIPNFLKDHGGKMIANCDCGKWCSTGKECPNETLQNLTNNLLNPTYGTVEEEIIYDTAGEDKL